MKTFAILALLPLAACATTQTPQPIVVTKEVVVPGPATPCVPKNLGPAPSYPDTDQALRSAPDAATRYQLLGAGRPLREARLRELEPVIASCAKAK